MLMQPGSPNPDYDFILKSGQKPKSNLLNLFGLPKIVVLGVGGALVLIILIIGFSLIFGAKKTDTQSLIDLAAHGQEISRVSSLVSDGSQDPNTKALATTTSAVLDSQEARITSYVTSTRLKLDPKLLDKFKNTANDSTVQTAIQNGTLSTTYNNYLTGSLNSYRIELTDQYKKASNAQLKSILSDAYDSVQTLLSATDHP